MKKIISSLAVCAAAVNLTSCGGISWTSYLKCVFAPGDCTTEECLIGVAIDDAVTQIMTSLSEGVDTIEEAEDLGDTMNTLLTAIENAERLGVKVPSKAKEAYNKALTRIWKHNYFGSEHLRTALKDARLL